MVSSVFRLPKGEDRGTCVATSCWLKAVEPLLGRCVVPPVAFSTHRTDHAPGVELVLKRMAVVLSAMIEMMEQAGPMALRHASQRQRQ